MAVDIVAVCAVASNHQASQSLAIWLSVLFLIYTTVSILLSALTIYTASQMNASAASAAREKSGAERNVQMKVTYAASAGHSGHGVEMRDVPPLVAHSR
jgi:hypothetical protein